MVGGEAKRKRHLYTYIKDRLFFFSLLFLSFLPLILFLHHNCSKYLVFCLYTSNRVSLIYIYIHIYPKFTVRWQKKTYYLSNTNNDRFIYTEVISKASSISTSLYIYVKKQLVKTMGSYSYKVFWWADVWINSQKIHTPNKRRSITSLFSKTFVVFFFDID